MFPFQLECQIDFSLFVKLSICSLLYIKFCSIFPFIHHFVIVINFTSSSSSSKTSSSCGALLDSVSLRERMEQIAAEQGLEGVAIGCANLLNNGLDSYLRGLIRSCVQLVGARSGHEPIRNNTKKQQTYMKLVNGLRPGLQSQISSGRLSEVMQEHAPNNLISLQDFRVAMELNSQQLGEDWPLLLEKICSRAFEE